MHIILASSERVTEPYLVTQLKFKLREYSWQFRPSFVCFNNERKKLNSGCFLSDYFTELASSGLFPPCPDMTVLISFLFLLQVRPSWPNSRRPLRPSHASPCSLTSPASSWPSLPWRTRWPVPSREEARVRPALAAGSVAGSAVGVDSNRKSNWNCIGQIL